MYTNKVVLGENGFRTCEKQRIELLTVIGSNIRKYQKARHDHLAFTGMTPQLHWPLRSWRKESRKKTLMVSEGFIRASLAPFIIPSAPCLLSTAGNTSEKINTVYLLNQKSFSTSCLITQIKVSSQCAVQLCPSAYLFHPPPK